MLFPLLNSGSFAAARKSAYVLPNAIKHNTVVWRGARVRPPCRHLLCGLLQLACSALKCALVSSDIPQTKRLRSSPLASSISPAVEPQRLGHVAAPAAIHDRGAGRQSDHGRLRGVLRTVRRLASPTAQPRRTRALTISIEPALCGGAGTGVSSNTARKRLRQMRVVALQRGLLGRRAPPDVAAGN
jgi:hypothetical protein